MRPQAKKYNYNLQECLDILYCGCKALSLPDKSEVEPLFRTSWDEDGISLIESKDITFSECSIGEHVYTEEISGPMARYEKYREGVRVYTERYYYLDSIFDFARQRYGSKCRICGRDSTDVLTWHDKILSFFSLCPFDECPLKKQYQYKHPSPLCTRCYAEFGGWAWRNRKHYNLEKASDIHNLEAVEMEIACLDFLAYKTKQLAKDKAVKCPRRICIERGKGNYRPHGRSIYA